MKRNLFILLVLVAVNIPAFAVISTEATTSENYMKKHGYSDQMVELVDLQKAQINGYDSTYERNEPSWYKTDKRASFIRKVFMYIDPGLDDGEFMQNNIDFSTNYKCW